MPTCSRRFVQKPLSRCRFLYSSPFYCRNRFVAGLAQNAKPVLLAEHALNESSEVVKATQRPAGCNVVGLQVGQLVPLPAQRTMTRPFLPLVRPDVGLACCSYRVGLWGPADRSRPQCAPNEAEKLGLAPPTPCPRFRYSCHQSSPFFRIVTQKAPCFCGVIGCRLALVP